MIFTPGILESMKGLKKPRRVGPAEAVSEIPNGAHLVVSGMAAEPRNLVREMVRQRRRLGGLTVYTSFPVGRSLYEESDCGFTIKTFSVGSLRKAVSERRASYIPCHFSDIGRLLSERILPVDVALFQVSEPDSNGFCTFGVSVEYYPEAATIAPLVIAEVNPRMPRTRGNSRVHESVFDLLVETEHALPEFLVEPAGEVENAIAAHCAEIIPDGAVLQFGPGSIQGSVLLGLSGKKELGIHSGLISDPVMDLLARGCITGSTKALNRNKIVCTSAIGTQKLYDFVRDNPMVEFHPSSYTHAAAVIGQMEKFISLNVALQVDLLGQVNSEALDGRIVNGLGGMVDFVRGARGSKGGKAIFCLPSTAKEGKVSRIVPVIPSGSTVSAIRADVDCVVSEYGVAALEGKTERERAEAICAIAHPRFREDLSAQIGILYS
jgi:4-hydroxybutyrate CoA-transferase